MSDGRRAAGRGRCVGHDGRPPQTRPDGGRPLCPSIPGRGGARGRGRRLHPGPTPSRATGDGPRLGRLGLRQPGRLPRAGRVLQCPTRPRRLAAGGPGRRLVLVHCSAADLPGRPVRTRPLPRPADLAGRLPLPGARDRRCALRHLVGVAVLRSAGHAQLLGRRRRPGRYGLLPACPRGPLRPRRPVGRGSERGADGRPHASIREVLALCDLHVAMHRNGAGQRGGTSGAAHQCNSQ